MQEKNHKKSFWPYGIIISTIMIVILCGYTIKVGLNNPVEYDTYFLSNKQTLDDNINSYLKSKEEFNKKFTTHVDYDKFKSTNNKIKIKITDKQTNEAIENAKFELLITRPDVSAFDIKPKFIGFKDGYYTFESFDIDKKGRWQILFTTKVDQYASFEKLETYAIID